MFRFLVILALAALVGCKPARSDVFVELVSPDLVKKMLAEADSFLPLQRADSNPNDNPLWVRGIMVFSKSPAKRTILWYDEADNVTGFLEYENNRLKDSILFFQNGQRMISVKLNNEGQPTGTGRIYHPDGRVHEDGRFEKGKRNGIWREFDKEGRLLTTHEYDSYGNKKR